MKKILLATTVFLLAGLCLMALNSSARRHTQELQVNRAAWLRQTRQLTEIQQALATVTAEISDRKQTLPGNAATRTIEPELSEVLLTNGVKFASPKIQDRLLASLGSGENSSAGYVLVSKAALQDAHLKPLKPFPESAKLTDAVRGALAITADEQRAVESAFADAFDAIGKFARENVRREGPADDMLAQFTIPADQAFREAWTQNLFAAINSAIGDERGELLRKCFEYYGIYEDGAIGGRTNILSIHRLTTAPGYGYRAGWRWGNSEAINTYPEPIKPDKFPPAFRFVFPGGWEELARREGFELPDEFKKN